MLQSQFLFAKVKRLQSANKSGKHEIRVVNDQSANSNGLVGVLFESKLNCHYNGIQTQSAKEALGAMNQ